MNGDSLAHRDDFQSVVDHLEGVAIWTVSEPREFEYISSGFEDTWGISPDVVRDDVDALVERIHPDDREKFLSVVMRDEGDVEDESFEHRVVRPDGEVRWVHARLFTLRDADGGVERLVGISTDITEQKRREQELEILNRVVRHDIRNDMAIVLGWAESLEDSIDDEGRDRLRRILSAGERIVELTETARDYVEVITGREEAHLKPTPLRPTLMTEVDLRRESYPDATFVVDGEIPDVDVAANEMLSSVFRNVLSNAVQHNDGDDKRVVVDVTVGDEAVSVRVTDNGPGIPDVEKERVFGKGHRGFGSPGTGIGLYLVQMLVSKFGGSVRVDDADPTGTVFTIRLRRADASEGASLTDVSAS